MKAAWYESKGPAAEVLRVGDIPRPEPGEGEVLVAMRASGVNPSDTKGRAGARGNNAMPWPRIIPHQDGAGIIEAVGPGVPPGRVGERVWVFEAQLGRAGGTAAEYAAVPARNAVPLPDGVSFEEGACLGVPALTAHRCVFADGPVEGKTVLVTGGAGAVGFYAVQFASRGGARVIATVSSDEQAETARRAGAEVVIDRKREDIVAEVARQAGAGEERAVDRVIEVAFGANLPDTLRMLKPGGVIAAYSSDAEPEPVLPFWPLVLLNSTVHFVIVYVMDWAAHEAAIASITEGLEGGWLRHNVGTVLPLERIAEAHEAVEQGRGGKTVVTI